MENQKKNIYAMRGREVDSFINPEKELSCSEMFQGHYAWKKVGFSYKMIRTTRNYIPFEQFEFDGRTDVFARQFWKHEKIVKFNEPIPGIWSTIIDYHHDTWYPGAKITKGITECCFINNFGDVQLCRFFAKEKTFEISISISNRNLELICEAGSQNLLKPHIEKIKSGSLTQF